MSKHKNKEFVGFYVSETVNDCLRLQSLLQDLGRVGVLARKILLDYAIENNWTVDDLVDRYAKVLYGQWDLRYKESTPFKDYLSNARVVMEERNKLPKRLIIAISTRCEELHQNQSAIK